MRVDAADVVARRCDIAAARMRACLRPDAIALSLPLQGDATLGQ